MCPLLWGSFCEKKIPFGFQGSSVFFGGGETRWFLNFLFLKVSGAKDTFDGTTLLQDLVIKGMGRVGQLSLCNMPSGCCLWWNPEQWPKPT